MQIGKINPYADASTVKTSFLGWERLLEVQAVTYKLFNIGAPVTTLKYETATPEEDVFVGKIGDGIGGGWDDNDVTGLKISATLAGLITNYAVLRVGTEIVVVSAVDRNANTISVFKRGVGETTAAAHADQVDAHILGFNIPKGVKDIETTYKEQTTDYNCVGKYTVDALGFTKEDISIQRNYYGQAGFENYVADQMLAKDRKLVKTMNKLMIYGTRELGDATKPAQTRGLIEEAMLKGNVYPTFGAISSVAKINTALTASRNKGGTANVLLCGPSTFDDIQKLGTVENQLPQILNRLSVEIGTKVTNVVTVVGTLTLVMDLDFPDDQFIVLNTADLSIHPLIGFTTPGGDKSTAQESTRNDQAFTYDTLTQIGTHYQNSNKNITIVTGVTR